MSRKPNFIVIHTDQQRYDCIGAAGRRTGIYTPYIDSIAWQGAFFSGAYAGCPVCIPQRLSLLTGQSVQKLGLFGNVGIPYLPLETTLPTEMRRGGYQTALVGRNMHTYPSAHAYGFEYYLPGDPSSEVKDSTDPFFTYLRDNTPRDAGGYYGCGAINNSRAAAPFHLPDHFHQTKWATNRALDFLDNRDPSRPYLLFVGYYAPHSPHNPPAAYFDRYYSRENLDGPWISEYDVRPENSGISISSYVDLKGEELRAMRAGYYGNIAFLDSQIGRLLSRVMFDRNTYVIFTSDHGELLGDHYLTQKQYPFEGSAHIPLVMMGPGIEQGLRIDRPVGWHDLMPTLLELAGLPVPDSVDGRSLAPLLRRESGVQWREYLHGECVAERYGSTGPKPTEDRFNPTREDGSHYLTDGKMKYIWHVTSGTEQLFDVEKDYREQYDLSHNPERQQELCLWRERLVRALDGREEGFTDGTRLIPGKKPQRVTGWLAEVCAQRRAEGFAMAYEPKRSPMNNLDFNNSLMI